MKKVYMVTYEGIDSEDYCFLNLFASLKAAKKYIIEKAKNEDIDIEECDSNTKSLSLYEVFENGESTNHFYVIEEERVLT